MSLALGLIALGVGYLVFASASREKKDVKLLGQITGIAIMVAALATTVCAGMKCMKGSCSFAKSKMMCLMGGAPAQEMPPAK